MTVNIVNLSLEHLVLTIKEHTRTYQMGNKIKVEKKFWNLLNITLIALFLALSTYVYIGFFHPDKTFLVVSWMVTKLQMAIWIFFPIAVFVFIALYRAVYLKLLKPGSVVVLLLLITFLILAVYPLAEYKYSNEANQRLSDIHTYLQLKPQIPVIRNDSNFTVFCLGGSTTEFKDNLERDWPHMVEEKIHSDFSKDVDVYNCGRQWYTTQHMLTNYVQNLKGMNPDVVIVMENINDLLQNADFSNLSNGEFRPDYGHFLGPFSNIVKYDGFTSLVFESLRKLWYQQEPQKIETDNFQGLQSYERNLKEIIQLAKADGTLVILMTQPNIYKDNMSDDELDALVMLHFEALGNGKQWSYETALRGLNKYNNKIRQIAKEENISLIDLEKAVPKSLDYFYDDVHYQSKAYDLISDHVSKQLSEILAERQLPKSKYRE